MKQLLSILFIAATALPQLAMAAKDTKIRVTLEEPAIAETYAGISNLRGWAAAPRGIDAVEVFIDGSFAFEVPMGGSRTDVGDQYPDYPDSEYSGYSMAFNYKNLVAGRHEMVVRAYDSFGDYNEATSYFFTDTFRTGFISDNSQVDISAADDIRQLDQHSLMMSGVSIEGKDWDVTLSWNRATQGFEISDISDAGEGAAIGGVYACVTSPVRTYDSTETLISMRNGTELNNYDGRHWSSNDSHIIFLANSGKWQTLQDKSALYLVDVMREPDSCIEPDYHEVVDITQDGQSIVYELSTGRTLDFDPTKADCNLDAIKVGHPVMFLQDFFWDYLLALNTGELCKS